MLLSPLPVAAKLFLAPFLKVPMEFSPSALIKFDVTFEFHKNAHRAKWKLMAA